MDFADIMFILIGLLSLWFFFQSIIGTIQENRLILRCTVETTAEVLSWRIEKDSDEPILCTPTIRYSFQGQIYEFEFKQGTVAKYQKEHRYAGDIMTILVDPDDHTNIIRGSRGSAVYRSLEGGIFICLVALFFILLGVLTVWRLFD